ncbi:MAG: cytochrome c nitrite reductase small subunit [Chloroflexi bacterium]|nr:cytochrome c nitrite reductase small subunit [Chloroflexota bacterium]
MTRTPFIIAVTAAVLALGLFIFVTDAPAYGGDAPETCNNCHAMDSQYENWYHAPHENVAKCVDCHLPHENVAAYYFEKGRQGMKDTYAFVTGNIPIAIRASDTTKEIIQHNCVRCHETTVETVMAGAQGYDRYCWECHRSVSHGERGSSIVPYQDSTLYPIK